MAGMFGIYGDYWKTLTARYPYLNSFAQRFLGRRAYKYMHIEEKDLEKIEQYVEEHRVTGALRIFTRWVREIKTAQEKETSLGMRQIFQYFHIAKAVNHFARAVDKFLDIARAKPKEFKRGVGELVVKYVPTIEKSVMDAEKWGGEDTKSLMAIMNRAKAKGGNLITNIKTGLKTRGTISRLGRFAFTGDIKTELRDEEKTESISRRLEKLEKTLETGSVKADKALADFQGILIEADKDIPEMYRVAHLVFKRDLLLIMMVLYDEEIIGQFGAEWIQKHFMPEIPVKERMLKVHELQEKLAEKAHEMANGLGVVVKKERLEERQFQVVIQKGMELRKAA